VRKTAASLLASCGEKAVPALERALADAEPLVRLAAARALAQAAPQAPSVEKLLRKLLLEDPDAGVRAGLASFLK
ncbi:MAG TPA: HEAT repeat domain-containing protein, partial [Elusimicrobiales bacterium]|nr:HEAT repeat domain-containing protein [Elusimicrobiales bacterium]